jgi:hypothetical protein
MFGTEEKTRITPVFPMDVVKGRVNTAQNYEKPRSGGDVFDTSAIFLITR